MTGMRASEGSPAPTRSRWRLWPIGIAVVIIGCLPLTCLVCSVVSYGPPTGAGRAALEKEGEALVAAVEAYRVKHGRYPPSLGAAGASARNWRYGGWHYGTSDGTDFYLEIGNYQRYGFLMWWNPERRDWDWDT